MTIVTVELIISNLYSEKMGETSLRQRKKKLQQKSEGKQVIPAATRDQTSEEEEDSDALWGFVQTISVILGVVVMVVMGYCYAKYCGKLLDNHLWFSNIKVS